MNYCSHEYKNVHLSIQPDTPPHSCKTHFKVIYQHQLQLHGIQCGQPTHLASLLVRHLAEAIAAIDANGAYGGIALGQVTPTAATHVADHRARLQVPQKLCHSRSRRPRRLLAVLIHIMDVGTFQSRRTAAGIT